ncbi:MAG: LytTR family DNA-binding domain-containing protein [Steroidobacteraceae bacterium]
MAVQNAQASVRALIVDDEEHGRSVLQSLLEPEEGIEIAGEAATAPEAARLIAEKKPDLVFMDIEIPGGSGIDVLRDIKGPAPYVIFVTAYPEYTLPAFELDAVDYLVKPIQRQRFAASVQRARLRIAEHRMAELAAQIAGAANAMNGAKATNGHSAKYSDHLTIRVRRRLVSLEVNDIAWIQGASQYSRVHTKSGEYLLSRTLASLECELDPRRFFRIHRSAIVNAAHVSEVRSYGDGRYNVHLNDGLALPMGRARREMLQKLLNGISSRSN